MGLIFGILILKPYFICHFSKPMHMKIIDINCDLGEGGKEDVELLKWVSSCNIACGGHSGNLETIRKTIAMAHGNKVKIGAHPSYPDQANFGRKSMNMALPALRVSLYNQIQEIREEAQNQGMKLHHVKPHGALYHDLKSDAGRAKMFIDLF